MRTYGRTWDADGRPTWVEVNTDSAGFNDLVWATTLCQVLLLNLNESPFFANYGIPGHASLIQQVAPDFYVMRTQQQFSQYFSNLVISRVQSVSEPVYRVNVTTNQGVRLNADVPIPV
jgi:hypothetical protein